MNDVYVLKRLEKAEADATVLGRWPTDFDRYEDVLRIAKMHGHAMRYADPIGTLPICIDLVGQNPGIEAEAVANLINVTLDQARHVLALARSEVTKNGYPYPWTAA